MDRFVRCLGAVALAVACASNATFESPTESAGRAPARKDQIVQINDGSVYPSPARILAGGSVTWTNESAFDAVVTFPSEIKGKLTCTEPLRPEWQYVAEGIQSIPIGQEDVVFPCALQPGTYLYTVSLFGGRGMSGMENPGVKIDGSLGVE